MTLRDLEEALKEKGFFPGTKLFLMMFYFLTPEQRENLYKKSNLPEVLWDELRIKLRDLPQGLSLEALRRTFEGGDLKMAKVWRKIIEIDEELVTVAVNVFLPVRKVLLQLLMERQDC